MPQDSQNSEQTPQETPTAEPQLSALDSGLLNIKNFKAMLLDAWNKITNLEQTNFALAVKFMSQGAYKDAALRLRMVLWINPKNPYAHYLLGKSYVYLGRKDLAVAPLKTALKAKPELEEASYLLAACGIGAVPERVPPSLMIEQIESIVSIYESQIANGLNRPVYELGTKMLFEELNGKQGFDILDLDMRTGRSGEYILPVANHIVGVEPCMQMISQARNRRIDDRLVYNELITKTAKDQLKREERKFGIIQSYFSSNAHGSLAEFFELVAKSLQPNALFLIACEGAAGEGFVFNTSKMTFQHSETYIKKVADKAGFDFIRQEKVNYQSSAFDLVFLFRKK